jgi:hypothetical protein
MVLSLLESFPELRGFSRGFCGVATDFDEKKRSLKWQKPIGNTSEPEKPMLRMHSGEDIEASRIRLEKELELQIKVLEQERREHLKSLDSQLEKAVDALNEKAARSAENKLSEHRARLAQLQGRSCCPSCWLCSRGTSMEHRTQLSRSFSSMSEAVLESEVLSPVDSSRILAVAAPSMDSSSRAQAQTEGRRSVCPNSWRGRSISVEGSFDDVNESDESEEEEDASIWHRVLRVCGHEPASRQNSFETEPSNVNMS